MFPPTEYRRPANILVHKSTSPQAAQTSQGKVISRHRMSRIPILRFFVKSNETYKYKGRSPPRSAIQKRVRFAADTKLYDAADDPTLNFERPRGDRKIDGFPVAGTEEFALLHIRLNRLYGPFTEDPYRDLPRDNYNWDLCALSELSTLAQAAQTQVPRDAPYDDQCTVTLCDAPDLSRLPRVRVESASHPYAYELPPEIVDAVLRSADPEHTLNVIVESIVAAR